VAGLCRGPFRQMHGKSFLCHVLQLCRVPVFVAHGKPCLCRVPDVWPTANVSAHGKRIVSGSDGEEKEGMRCEESFITMKLI